MNVGARKGGKLSLPVGHVHANRRHTAHSRDSDGAQTSASISRAPISHGAAPSPQSGRLRNGARTSVGSLKKPGFGGGCKTQFMQMGFHTPSDSVACLCTKAGGGRRCVTMRLSAACTTRTKQRQVSLGNADDQTAPAGRRADLQPEERRSIFPIRTPTNRDNKTQKRDTDTRKAPRRDVFGCFRSLFGSAWSSRASELTVCGRWSGFLCGSLSDGFIAQLFSFWIVTQQVLASPFL